MEVSKNIKSIKNSAVPDNILFCYNICCDFSVSANETNDFRKKL